MESIWDQTMSESKQEESEYEEGKLFTCVLHIKLAGGGGWCVSDFFSSSSNDEDIHLGHWRQGFSILIKKEQDLIFLREFLAC